MIQQCGSFLQFETEKEHIKAKSDARQSEEGSEKMCKMERTKKQHLKLEKPTYLTRNKLYSKNDLNESATW